MKVTAAIAKPVFLKALLTFVERGAQRRGGALLLHFTEIHVIVMFNFKCVAPQSSNRKQRRTSERLSRRACVDGAIFSSNPFSFLFKNRLSRGVAAKAVKLRLVVCFAAVGWGIIEAGYR